MKSTYSLIFFALFSSINFAQDSIPTAQSTNWASWGRVSFLFNQSAFNDDWQGGGVTNVSGNLGISYDMQYKRKKLSWDTKLISDFGLSQVKDQRYLRKTTDRLELNSILGNQIKQSYWNYSTIFNFRSQFISGYEFFTEEETGDDGVTRSIQKRRETSGGFSPSYFQLGLGFLWKKSKNFNFNIAPATTRLITVSSSFTDVDINDPDAVDDYTPFFGVEANKTARWEVGASFRGYTKFEVAKNIQMENVINLYSDYLADPENIDIDYNLNLFLKVNKYISGNFEFQAIYDDNTTRGFQIRQVIGLGFKYDLGERPTKKA
ncbi:DUF3078 domain-containing protein [Nonlabens ulvanivorans]|uniref:DUF3078 domain-containing protein n=1 Tax=Nonlabens ulvanivorans TaxID=906888 RepID=UPI002942DC26|nr:DUF3078 domain-containing protein [Nonlabens ulvanivorans]WOI23911.1 DUF3078 domain-containing protein [Nonlabens ulvanivorans]